MKIIAWLVAAACAQFALCTAAQDYPSKPVRLIVATAPGGLMDVPARLFAEHFEKAYGQRLLIENRGGAGGVLAGDAVAKAPPDGYTLGQIQAGNVAVNPFLVKDMPFDPLNDFAPVAPLTSSPVVVAIGARLPAGTLAEFIALAKREPGRPQLRHRGTGNDVRAWQNRPIDDCYLVVWIDALVVKVRVDGVVRNRPAYLVFGLNLEGKKEALALVIGAGDESAKFWLKVLNDLRNRGLRQVCVVCCDGLTALARSDRSGLRRRVGRSAVSCT